MLLDREFRDSNFRKKYRVAALTFIQTVVVRYALYRQYKKKNTISKVGYFKENFLFSKYSVFYILANFKRLRKKFKNKFSRNDDGDDNQKLKNIFNKYTDQFDDIIRQCEKFAAKQRKSTINSLKSSCSLLNPQRGSLKEIQEESDLQDPNSPDIMEKNIKDFLMEILPLPCTSEELII